MEREAIAVDEHPQGCQGNEEPAAEGGKADELVDLPGHHRQHHQGVLQAGNAASYAIHHWNDCQCVLLFFYSEDSALARGLPSKQCSRNPAS